LLGASVSDKPISSTVLPHSGVLKIIDTLGDGMYVNRQPRMHHD
jgi:hypothetical protein